MLVGLIEFMLQVKIICRSGVCKSVKESEEACCDICARVSFVASDPRCHLNDEGGRIHHHRDYVIDKFLKHKIQIKLNS